MPATLTWTDRLRIERLLWTLDTYLQSLPGRSRRAVRRELRTNLTASAAQVGTAEAIRQLGNPHHLAAEYLDAEYAGRPRPQLRKAVFWTLAVEIVILWTTLVAHAAFVDGAGAANPLLTGTLTWDSLRLLGVGGDVTYVDGQVETLGIWVNQWLLLHLLAAFVIGGRLWRLVPLWLGRRRNAVGPDGR